MKNEFAYSHGAIIKKDEIVSVQLIAGRYHYLTRLTGPCMMLLGLFIVGLGISGFMDTYVYRKYGDPFESASTAALLLVSNVGWTAPGMLMIYDGFKVMFSQSHSFSFSKFITWVVAILCGMGFINAAFLAQGYSFVDKALVGLALTTSLFLLFSYSAMGIVQKQKRAKVTLKSVEVILVNDFDEKFLEN